MNKDKVLSTIDKYKMLCASDSVAVGVSGGADSMALLSFLLEVKDELKLNRIIACHFNHGLRGEESDNDEKLVREFCKKKDVEFVFEKGEMLNRQIPKGESTESYARELRYDFLKRSAEKIGAKIATAHNMNDVAETVIFNLMRGAGIKGACGIPPVRGNIIRPFIETERSQIEDYCRDKGIEYATDSTNLTDEYTRNVIRHKVIPVLISLNQNTVSNISRFSVQAIEAETILKENNERIKQKSKIENGFDAKILRRQSEAEKKYFFKELINEYREPSSELVLLAYGLLDSSPSKIQLNSDYFLISDSNTISVNKESKTVSPAFCEKLSLNENPFINGGSVYVEEVSIKNEQAENFSSGLLNNSVDCAKIVGNVVLRNRRDGDIFKSNRSGNSKTLKKLFNERKISPEKRYQIPIVSDELGIIWIYGEGVAKRAAADRNTEKALHFNFIQGEDKL